MLYNLFLNYIETFTFLNVFKYITFRTGLAFFTSLLIALLIGGPFIRLFSNRKIFNPIRTDGPTDHIVKKIGTPTMGGIIILIGLIISVLLWADLTNIYILFQMEPAKPKPSYTNVQKLGEGSYGDAFLVKEKNSGEFYVMKTVNMSQLVLVTMGALKSYTVHAYDVNCLDEVDIGVQGQLPPGAVMAAQHKAPSPVACDFPSAKQSVARTLEWLAPPNYGGNLTQICFTATDVAGSCYGPCSLLPAPCARLPISNTPCIPKAKEAY